MDNIHESKAFLETTFRPRDWVIQKIESMIEKLLSNIANGSPPVLQTVSNVKRRECHTEYDVQSGTLRRKSNNFKDVSFLKNPRGFAIIIRILDICHELLIHDVTATKRDIYYKDVRLFGNQHTVDAAIDELACLFRVPRACLNVTASAKGLVAGALKIIQKDKTILDCQSLNNQGILIPTDQIDRVETNAEFVLVVEKEATFQYLLSSRIFEKFGPCIIITGKGYPDLATRQLVKILGDLRHSNNLINSFETIPILGFFDNDPYGIEILSVYKFGSTAMSFDNENLATPIIKWLGLHCADWQKYNISKNTLLPLTSADRKKAYQLLQREYFQDEWRNEICRMLYMEKKAEMQSLCENDDILNYLMMKFKCPNSWL
ncbi:Spo11/DNA topoisomerase VI subunit A [Gigaspora rosea]|uniref:DNA topoisomerase (ATP-hydrolyzing) n=1 Tax=Gigaspora rosea TaxID=44941 RepID=A0A397VXG3_9GLOM|nr:Spo11/DNA topoisomerase VI subunit A [Gigaspora rosea]